MKIIKDISLELDYEENLHTSKQYTSDFSFRCRFIGNYLRRQLKQINFELSGYNRLFISASRFAIIPNAVLENVLRVSVPFDQIKYDNLSKIELPDFFIELYKEGLLKASQTHKIPAEFLLVKLEEFKSNAYLNEWEFKSKLFSEIGLKARLICKMTMDFFSLTLVVTKKSELIFSEEILNTLPDEMIFQWQFKEIILESHEIKVIDEFKKPIYSLDISFKS